MNTGFTIDVFKSFENEHVTFLDFNEKQQVEYIMNVSYLYQNSYEILLNISFDNSLIEDTAAGVLIWESGYYFSSEMKDEISRLIILFKNFISDQPKYRMDALFTPDFFSFEDYSRFVNIPIPYIKGLSPLYSAVLWLRTFGCSNSEIAIHLYTTPEVIQRILDDISFKAKLGKIKIKNLDTENLMIVYNNAE